MKDKEVVQTYMEEKDLLKIGQGDKVTTIKPDQNQGSTLSQPVSPGTGKPAPEVTV